MYDTIDFHDIAGLVRGAHEGEGLGNKFLANIREVDAIVHVVRAHHDANVIHPEGEVDPRRDIDTIETELLYADLEQAERRLERVTKQARGGDKQAQAEERWLTDVVAALQEGRPARTVPVPADAPDALRNLHPLTAKPVLLVANVDEGDDAVPPAVAEHAARDRRAGGRGLLAHRGRAVRARRGGRERRCATTWASASPACGASSTAPSRCCTRSPSSPPARTSRRSPGTCATASRAWHAAGEIHSDIQKGFVRAEVVGWEALVEAGGYAGARERGVLRLEGRDYVMRDGDVITVKFTP